MSNWWWLLIAFAIVQAPWQGRRVDYSADVYFEQQCQPAQPAEEIGGPAC